MLGQKLSKAFKDACYRYCPDGLLHKIIRRNVKINYDAFNDCTVKIADEQNETRETLHMLYRAYLNAGKIKPNDAQIHFVPPPLLAETEMVIYKKNNAVIGTARSARPVW